MYFEPCCFGRVVTPQSSAERPHKLQNSWLTIKYTVTQSLLKLQAKMALASIKEKMQKVKDAIDDAEEREAEAKGLLREAEVREEAQLNEAESMRRRLILLGEELQKTEDRLAEAEEKLYNEKHKTETHEEVRKGLEDYEMEGDEKIQEIEQSLKDQESKAKESTDRLVEAQRREVVLNLDLERAIAKGDVLEERIEKLTETLEKGAEQVKSLEENEEEKFEREEENEEKVKFLEEQVKQLEQRYDIAERETQKLERLGDQLQTEISHYDNLTQEQQQEMQNALTELDCFDDWWINKSQLINGIKVIDYIRTYVEYFELLWSYFEATCCRTYFYIISLSDYICIDVNSTLINVQIT